MLRRKGRRKAALSLAGMVGERRPEASCEAPGCRNKEPGSLRFAVRPGFLVSMTGQFLVTFRLDRFVDSLSPCQAFAGDPRAPLLLNGRALEAGGGPLPPTAVGFTAERPHWLKGCSRLRRSGSRPRHGCRVGNLSGVNRLFRLIPDRFVWLGSGSGSVPPCTKRARTFWGVTEGSLGLT